MKALCSPLVGPSCQADGESARAGTLGPWASFSFAFVPPPVTPLPLIGHGLTLERQLLCSSCCAAQWRAQPSFLRYQVICLCGLLLVRIMQGIIMLLREVKCNTVWYGVRYPSTPGCVRACLCLHLGEIRSRIQTKGYKIRHVEYSVFCAVIAIAEIGATWIFTAFPRLCTKACVYLWWSRSRLTLSAGAMFADGKQKGKNKKRSSLFPWPLCIGSLVSAVSYVRDGNTFLWQVWDSHWVQQGLGCSQWSRPILTRRCNAARATRGSSDFQFIFSSHVLQLRGYPPGEPSQGLMCAAWVSQSHFTPVVLKNKRPPRW